MFERIIIFRCYLSLNLTQSQVSLEKKTAFGESYPPSQKKTKDATPLPCKIRLKKVFHIILLNEDYPVKINWGI